MQGQWRGVLLPCSTIIRPSIAKKTISKADRMNIAELLFSQLVSRESSEECNLLENIRNRITKDKWEMWPVLMTSGDIRLYGRTERRDMNTSSTRRRLSGEESCRCLDRKKGTVNIEGSVKLLGTYVVRIQYSVTINRLSVFHWWIYRLSSTPTNYLEESHKNIATIISIGKSRRLLGKSYIWSRGTSRIAPKTKIQTLSDREIFIQ